MKKPLILSALALTLAACSGSPSGGVAADVTGTWQGTLINNFTTGDLKFTFAQVGNTVTGRLFTALPGKAFDDHGPITGTRNGNALTLTAQPSADESYTFSGSVSGNTYLGTATYTLTGYGSQSATFSVKRQ